MTIQPVEALLGAFARIADGQPVAAAMREERVPQELRLLLAASMLAAADRPVTGRSVVALAGVSRSATYRERHALLARLVEAVPGFVHQGLREARPGRGAVELQRELEFAHRSIATERARLKEREAELAAVVSYAAELDHRLRLEREVIRQEQHEKVRRLRVAPPPEAT